MIGLYQELDGETATALFLPATTDSLFLRFRPSHGLPFHNPIRKACRQPKNVAIHKLQRHRGLIRKDPVYHFYPDRAMSW